MTRLATLCLLALAGCGYNATILKARDALDDGDSDAALRQIDRGLGVSSPSELPRAIDGDKALLVLQRASLLQALGRYADSRRDFAAAETALDELDVSRARRVRSTMTAVGWIGAKAPNGEVVSVKDLASVCNAESPGLEYAATPTERALLTALNVANWLALGDAPGASVEARRLEPTARFAHDHGDVAPDKTLAFGAWLGAFGNEKAEPAAATATAAATALATADLLVVLERGRAPAKTFTTRPIADVEAEIDGAIPPAMIALGRQRMEQEAAGMHVEAYEPARPLTMRVPVLDGERVSTAALTIDGAPLAPAAPPTPPTPLAAFELDVAGALSAEWARDEKRHLAACWVCGCPSADLRGWETLPSSIVAVRAKLPPGRHVIEGGRAPVVVDLAPGDWKTIVLAAR